MDHSFCPLSTSQMDKRLQVPELFLGPCNLNVTFFEFAEVVFPFGLQQPEPLQDDFVGRLIGRMFWLFQHDSEFILLKFCRQSESDIASANVLI